MATLSEIEYVSEPNRVSIQDGPARFVLDLNGEIAMSLVQMALSLVLISPDSDGKFKSLEILKEGGAEAVKLSIAIIRSLFSGSAIHGKNSGDN